MTSPLEDMLASALRDTNRWFARNYLYSLSDTGIAGGPSIVAYYSISDTGIAANNALAAYDKAKAEPEDTVNREYLTQVCSELTATEIALHDAQKEIDALKKDYDFMQAMMMQVKAERDALKAEYEDMRTSFREQYAIRKDAESKLEKAEARLAALTSDVAVDAVENEIYSWDSELRLCRTMIVDFLTAARDATGEAP